MFYLSCLTVISIALVSLLSLAPFTLTKVHRMLMVDMHPTVIDGLGFEGQRYLYQSKNP